MKPVTGSEKENMQNIGGPLGCLFWSYYAPWFNGKLQQSSESRTANGLDPSGMQEWWFESAHQAKSHDRLRCLRASWVAQPLVRRLCLQWRSCRRRGFDPWVGRMPWRDAWLPTPGWLPGESHGQRNLLQPRGSRRVGHDWGDWGRTKGTLRAEGLWIGYWKKLL